jgi:hypothetical protein
MAPRTGLDAMANTKMPAPEGDRIPFIRPVVSDRTVSGTGQNYVAYRKIIMDLSYVLSDFLIGLSWLGKGLSDRIYRVFNNIPPPSFLYSVNPT